MKNNKILVVDDDEGILFAFEQVLKKEGYISVLARDGIEALEKFIQDQPVIIIFDLTLPEMKELETLSQIRELNRETPVILITSQDMQLNENLLQQVGVWDCLVKPLSVQKIRQSIKKALMDSGF